MLRSRFFSVALLVFASACGRTMLPVPTDGGPRADGGDGSVPLECVRSAECDDGVACNGAEACTDGKCVAGTPLVCDDGVACTTDACDVGLDRCVSTPDSDVCASMEICDARVGCIAKACTTDAGCDDGFICNGVETCGSTGFCEPGTEVDCDDGIACTRDVCASATGVCSNPPDDGACADGSFCNGIELCVAGVGCSPALRPACDVSDACATVVCSEATHSCSMTMRDDDGDGAIAMSCGGDDCDDSNSSIRPSAPETCNNGVDDNCDGLGDCADMSCAGTQVCCVPSAEQCSNGADEDCDGAVDCADPDCASQQVCCVPQAESCSNGVDDDCDGLVDCADTAACGGSASCCMPTAAREICRNGPDDDCDGLRDCADPDCAGSLECSVPCLPQELCAPLGLDADCDGIAGCADSDCAGTIFCR